MDKFASIGNLCKELVLDIVSPYKYTRVEELVSDEEISAVEKSAKCTALAVGNLLTNAMMLSIELIKKVSISVHDGYMLYVKTDDIHVDEDQQLNDSEDESVYTKAEISDEINKSTSIDCEYEEETCDDNHEDDDDNHEDDDKDVPEQKE